MIIKGSVIYDRVGIVPKLWLIPIWRQFQFFWMNIKSHLILFANLLTYKLLEEF